VSTPGNKPPVAGVKAGWGLHIELDCTKPLEDSGRKTPSCWYLITGAARSYGSYDLKYCSNRSRDDFSGILLNSPMPESSQIALSTAGKDRPDIAMPNDSGDAIEYSARPSDLFAQSVVQPDGPLWISKADLHRTGLCQDNLFVCGYALALTINA
jgi:hypothetical protein